MSLILLAAATILSLVYSMEEPIHGLSYNDWAAKWWEWNIGNPEHTTETLVQLCGHQQHWNHDRPVWFLAGNSNNLPGGFQSTIKCDVPSGQSIFFPIIDGICPFDPAIDVGLGSQINATIHCGEAYATKLFMNLDGNKYDKQTLSAFGLLHDTEVKGVDGGHAVIVGTFIMLKPLSEGTHYLHFVAEDAHGFKVDTTYYLTVK